MTLRVSSADLKYSVGVAGSLQVSSMSAKFGIDGIGALRVSQMTVKWAIGYTKISRIIRIIPPVPLRFICSCNPVCCFTYG